MFLGPIEFFKTKDDTYRADDWENATLVAGGSHVGSVQLKMPTGKILEGQLKEARIYIPQDDKYFATHLFCSCYLDSNFHVWPSNVIDPRMRQFGDTVLIIRDVDTFFERLKATINTSGRNHVREMTCRAVEYVADNFSGQYCIFKKRDRYSYQREFRFALSAPNERGRPFVLSLGDLSDIAEIFALNSFANRTQVTGNEASLLV